MLDVIKIYYIRDIRKKEREREREREGKREREN